jgi:U3 small nucleolar RNA-associated protein 19
MPFLEIQTLAGKKRKRHDPADGPAKPDTEASTNQRNKSKDIEKEIKILEARVLESRRNYNDISELLSIAADETDAMRSMSASMSLCRVFGLLMANGSLTKSRNTSEAELAIIKWLRDQYAQYAESLLGLLGHAIGRRQEVALELLMRLVREESIHLSNQGDLTWKSGTFAKILQILADSPATLDAMLEIFIRSYLVEYDDIRYWIFYLMP